MLTREIENLLSGNPMFRMFSGPISNWVISTIDPYVDAFFMGTNHINTDAAASFVKEELDNKVDSFIARFKSEQNK